MSKGKGIIYRHSVLLFEVFNLDLSPLLIIVLF